MEYLIYAIPVAVIAVIFVVMMPIMKKKSAQITQDMGRIQNMKVHLSMLVGTLKSVNGESADLLPSAGTYYGVDQTGSLTVEFVPCFTYGGTTYTGRSPMCVTFDAAEGKTYEMNVSTKEPKDDANVIHVAPVTDDKLIFKTTFFIITTDVTDTQNARVMRGIMS